jgi:ribonuclease P protein subunit POP4
MAISPENLAYHELVGLHAVICESPDVTLREVSGMIVGESKNMLTIRNDVRTVRIAKQVASRIQLATDHGVCFISGSSLIGRPEDRLARLS